MDKNKITILTDVKQKNGVDSVMIQFRDRKSTRLWKRELDKLQRKERKLISQGDYTKNQYSSNHPFHNGQKPSPVEGFINEILDEVFYTLRKSGKLTSSTWYGEIRDHNGEGLIGGEFHNPISKSEVN